MVMLITRSVLIRIITVTKDPFFNIRKIKEVSMWRARNKKEPCKILQKERKMPWMRSSE